MLSSRGSRGRSTARRYLPRRKSPSRQEPVSDSTTPVLVSTVRTPIGRYLGGLSPLTAPQLGALVIREAIARAGIAAAAVEEVLMGQVVQGGSGQAPARQALIGAGIPATTSAVTINEVCGSGLRAVMLAAQAIRAGDRQGIGAGGHGSTAHAPHHVAGMRRRTNAGSQPTVDGLNDEG